MNLRIKSEYIKQTVTSLGQGADRPGWHHLGGNTLMKI